MPLNRLSKVDSLAVRFMCRYCKGSSAPLYRSRVAAVGDDIRSGWNMRWIPVLAECLVGAAIVCPGSASGAPASGDTQSQSVTTLEDIIVTAQKREENLQTVPIAISAYTSKQRDLRGIDTVQDLAKFTPGMVYSTSLDRTFIRGVGRQTNNLATEPGVAVYFDGVYSGSILSASGDSLFLDRLEVLRGPQGTLYGKNGCCQTKCDWARFSGFVRRKRPDMADGRSARLVLS